MTYNREVPDEDPEEYEYLHRTIVRISDYAGAKCWQVKSTTPLPKQLGGIFYRKSVLERFIEDEAQAIQKQNYVRSQHYQDKLKEIDTELEALRGYNNAKN